MDGPVVAIFSKMRTASTCRLRSPSGFPSSLKITVEPGWILSAFRKT